MCNRKLRRDSARYIPNDGTKFSFRNGKSGTDNWECWDRDTFVAIINHQGEGEISIDLRDDFDSYSFLPAIKLAFHKYAIARAAAVDLR